ncbi:hypothetical protein B7494_g111 [Chlorociboria aeruginascens]|nr:hypothetical protein B7494_g111 [Chlorociboria aeruginascens]
MSPPRSQSLDPQQLAKMPKIGPDDAFVKVVKSLSVFFVNEITMPSTFEQLRTTSAGNSIRVLVEYLVINITNPALINALLTLKWHFSTLEVDDRGINETRANACEIVAWRFLSRISERDAADFCLYELPNPTKNDTTDASDREPETTERSSLLPQFRTRDPVTPVRPVSKRVELLRSISNIGGLFSLDSEEHGDEEDPTSSFTGLNGLEIAAVADCKRFLSQRIVQKIVNGIWIGNITFWDRLSADTKKKPQIYHKRHSDLFTRLRVPIYIKAFEVLFFASFLFLYYAVLVERNPYHITPLEIILYEQYSMQLTFGMGNNDSPIETNINAISGVIGLFKDSASIIDISFDILSLEALFMVPRYVIKPWGLELANTAGEYAKDFVKFMVVVAILYLGFLTTFTLLARDSFTLSQMSWILIKVFFGSSYLGFDIMNKISPQLGPPLMLIFVCMTNILLITSLISILSDSFSKVIAHAREEYLFVYSVYVLEASTSNRLTHFYPPLNLIPLIFIRPLRLFISAEKLRSARILLLKITHTPFIAAIWLFESAQDQIGGESTFSYIGPSAGITKSSTSGTMSKKQRPFLSTRIDTKRSSRHFNEIPDRDGSESPSPQSYSLESKKIRDGKTVLVDNAGLEEKIADLSNKIAELTALFMAQQGAAEES